MTVSATTNTTSTSSTTSSTQSDLTAGASNLSTSYSTFMTMLTTQLKNQDPTSPLDPNQFTQQLVQMTGVQQQLLSNQLLQQLVDNSSSGQTVTGAVGMIGKTVTASSPTTSLSGGSAGWAYNLASAASSATLTIKNAAGTAVWTGSAPDDSAGTHSFTWNGKDSSGNQLPDGGSYTLSIAATDANGGSVTATPLIQGVVSSVQTASGSTVLQIGAAQVPLSSVTSVSATN